MLSVHEDSVLLLVNRYCLAVSQRKLLVLLLCTYLSLHLRRAASAASASIIRRRSERSSSISEVAGVERGRAPVGGRRGRGRWPWTRTRVWRVTVNGGKHCPDPKQ
jgi:hypothetical protein